MKKLMFLLALMSLPVIAFTQDKQEDKKELPKATVAVTVDQGASVDSSNDKTNVTKTSAEAIHNFHFDEHPAAIGAKVQIGQDKGIGDKVYGNAEMIARIKLIDSFLRGSMTGGAGLGYSALSGEHASLSIGTDINLCSDKESDKKEWTVCWVNNGKITLISGQQVNSGGRFEIVSGPEISKRLNKDVRISAGARYSFTYELKGDQANTTAYSQAITGGIGLTWDFPHTSKK